jgi:hypothetical protein
MTKEMLPRIAAISQRKIGVPHARAIEQPAAGLLFINVVLLATAFSC